MMAALRFEKKLCKLPGYEWGESPDLTPTSIYAWLNTKPVERALKALVIWSRPKVELSKHMLGRLALAIRTDLLLLLVILPEKRCDVGQEFKAVKLD